MKKSLLPLLIGMTLTGVAGAQQAPTTLPLGMSQTPVTLEPAGTFPPVVPALQPTPVLGTPAAATAAPSPATPPPPVNLLSDKDSTLTNQEQSDVARARKWMDGRNITASGTNGAVVFRLGEALPSIVCAPLYVCDVALQPGELVNNVLVGDPIRWKVSPASSGAGADATVHLVIKPADIGLTTNLIVTTDRRTYSLKLVSRKDDYMPAIAFSYPEDEAAAWAKLTERQAAARAANVLPDTGGQRVDRLDFDYSLGGDRPSWKPLRVYADGVKTYIEFPKSITAADMPVLVAIADDKKAEMVNYRVEGGNRFVVDKVLDRAELLSGVGRHQVEVTISHTRS